MIGVDSQDKYWLGFNLVAGIGTSKLQALLDYFGSPAAAWQATDAEMQRLGLDKRARENLAKSRTELDLDAKLAELEQAGVQLLHWDSPQYPAYLKEIPAPPPVLYMRGRFDERDQMAVAIVGTRRLTSYGRQMTRDLTAGLVRHGVTIVSGLARGIDAIAHKTALELGGRTIAVLGSGLKQIYPPENRGIAQEIVERDMGVIISEYELNAKPQAKNFPPRNRIISGLSLGVIIVEGDVKSGALITAKFALEQNREVFAVPGNVTSPTSEGPNSLIQQGAKLVTSVADVFDELDFMQKVEQAAVQLALPESAEEAALLPHLSITPQHIDDICRAAELPAALVSSTLTLMELKGLVQNVGGMNYSLIREAAAGYITDQQTQPQQIESNDGN